MLRGPKNAFRRQRRRRAFLWMTVTTSLFILTAAATVTGGILLLLNAASERTANPTRDNDNDVVLWQRLLLQQTTTTVSNNDDNSYHDKHRHPVFDEHHAPLFPLTTADYWGFGLAAAGLVLAAGGGIGGGGMLVPIYCLVLGFSPKHAIPLSNVTVFGGAVANTLLNLRKRHPVLEYNRPLIDADLILVMEPLTIAGALLGTFMNKVLPELLLTVLLVLLLSVTAHKSLTKAVSMYRAETVARQRQTGQRPNGTMESELTRLAKKEDEDDEDDEDDLEEEEDNDDVDKEDEEAVDESDAKGSIVQNGKEEASSEPGDVEQGGTEPPTKTLHDDDDDDDDDEQSDQEEEEEEVPLTHTINNNNNTKEQNLQLAKILQEERHLPMTNIKILVTLFVVVLSLNILKGGGAFSSPIGITCGSTAFWMANAVMLLWILVVAWHCRNYLLHRHAQKLACGYPYDKTGDIQWDARATVVYPLICGCAGFFAGMFGIGGGIVKGPLLLAMGVHPAVASASSAAMILFTSFTATTSFVVFGLLEAVDYAAVCLSIGLLATFCGQVGLSYLMRRAQRNSYIAFSIGGVVLLSAFLMTIQSLLSMAEGEQHHAGGICGKED